MSEMKIITEQEATDIALRQIPMNSFEWLTEFSQENNNKFEKKIVLLRRIHDSKIFRFTWRKDIVENKNHEFHNLFIIEIDS